MRDFVAVFDNAPLGPAPWMKKAAEAAGLFFVDQDAIARVLSEDPGFQKAMLSPKVKSFSNPHQHPSLAEYYQAALDKLAPNEPKLALHGWGWLVFAEKVHAVVFDFAGFEAEKKKLEKTRQLKPAQAAEHFEKAKNVLRDQAKKKVFPNRIIELDATANDEAKAKRVIEFLGSL